MLACVAGVRPLSRHHFAVDSGGKLYVFQKGVYKPTGESYIKRRVKAILGALDVPQQWSSRKAEEVVKYIAVDAPELWYPFREPRRG